MHYIHLGRVGLVVNFRWAEIANFIVGWTTLDFEHNSDPTSGHIMKVPAQAAAQ